MSAPITEPRPTVSFEVFPPKDDGPAVLDGVVDRLCGVGPAYFSVTYGAGGSTRDRTRATVDRLQARTGLPIAHHLTCVEATRAEIDAQAHDLWQAGIRKIVALRGDPQGGKPYAPPVDGYAYAGDLVEGLMRVADFDLAVAAYPEVHPQAASAAADMDALKRKVDAGARSAITQYAFDTDAILRFVDNARAAGITVPIIPGIMPVGNLKGLIRFSERCGAHVPDWLVSMFAGLDDDPSTRAMVATAVATEQCRRLMEAGLTEFHFYTLNRAEISVAVCRALGLADHGGTRQAA
ncbi:MAG: methylenetetrahydrofolate reductase [NAD(P)H] [Pseudomonadota bacterium]